MCTNNGAICPKDVLPQLYALMPDVESVFRPTLHLRLPETAAAVVSAVLFYGIAGVRRGIYFPIA